MSKQPIDHGIMTPSDSTSDKGWLRIQTARRKQDLKHVMRQVRILSLALRHPKVPWYAKMIAGCSLGYLVSPIQLIPTFIPVIGQLDDLFVLFVGMKLVRKLTPSDVFAACEARVCSPTMQRIEIEAAALTGREEANPAIL